MMRSLWTAASGMKAQQTAMDNLSNNLANINTTGYKKERLEFQSLLYQTIQKRRQTMREIQNRSEHRLDLALR